MAEGLTTYMEAVPPFPQPGGLMETLLNIAIALTLLFVVGVLGMGLWNMLKAGPGNTSQKLMRLRVIGQAVALALLLGALFFFGGGNR